MFRMLNEHPVTGFDHLTLDAVRERGVFTESNLKTHRVELSGRQTEGMEEQVDD